jgi:hypothetical protein
MHCEGKLKLRSISNVLYINIVTICTQVIYDYCPTVKMERKRKKKQMRMKTRKMERQDKGKKKYQVPGINQHSHNQHNQVCIGSL